MFGEGFARRMAKRYRRRGLDAAAGRLADFLARDGLDGATVLEVGGGVGEIGLELLRRGAASVTNVELSTAYDLEARRLAEQLGVADRVRRRIVDVAAAPDAVGRPTSWCCTGWCAATRLRAAAGRGRGPVPEPAGVQPPARDLGSRAVVATQNALFALWGKEFRTFAHPPEAMVAVVASRGLKPVYAHPGWIWHVEGLAR